jgi:hypothetical protein
VALATVLVIIRHDTLAAAPLTRESGIGEHFAKVLSQSWSTGVRALVESIGGLVKVVIGGLLWWLGLFGIGLLVQVLFKRWRAARALT